MPSFRKWRVRSYFQLIKKVLVWDNDNKYNNQIYFQEITVTLYRDQRQEEYDNKDWFFVLEDVRNEYFKIFSLKSLTKFIFSIINSFYRNFWNECFPESKYIKMDLYRCHLLQLCLTLAIPVLWKFYVRMMLSVFFITLIARSLPALIPSICFGFCVFFFSRF